MHVNQPRERVVVADDVPGVLGTLGQSALKKVHIGRGLEPFQRGLQHGETRTGIPVGKQGRIFGGHLFVCGTVVGAGQGMVGVQKLPFAIGGYASHHFPSGAFPAACAVGLASK